MDDVMQGNDVGVLEFFEQGCFSDGGEWRTFLLLQPNLLKSHDLVRQTKGGKNGDWEKEERYEICKCTLGTF